MHMRLGWSAILFFGLFFGCAREYASSDTRGDGSQGSDASADDGGRTGDVGRSASDRDPSHEPGATVESDHAADESASEVDVARATSESDAADEMGASATAGAAVGATDLDPSTLLCGERAVCVTPRADPLEACRASFTAFAAAHILFAPIDCTLVPSSTARAGSGPIRGVAFAMVEHSDVGEPMFAILEGDQGYDRVVHLMDIDAGINQDSDYAVRSVAIEDLVPGGALEARVELTRTIRDSACTEPLMWETTRRDVAICGVDAAGRSYCTPPIPRRYVERESTYDYETGKTRPTAVRRFALDVRFVGGEISVRGVRGPVPGDFQPLLGRRAPEAVTGSRY